MKNDGVRSKDCPNELGTRERLTDLAVANLRDVAGVGDGRGEDGGDECALHRCCCGGWVISV